MAYSPMQLAKAFLQAGELPDALDALNQHLDAHPQDAEALRLKAQVLTRQPGQLQAALATLAQLTEHLPEDVMLHATLLERLGKPEAEVLSVLKNGHQQHPDHDRLTERYLYTLRANNALDTAQALLKTLVQRQPAHWRWRQWAGDIAVDAGKPKTALAHYTAALDHLQQRYQLDTSQNATVMQDATISDAASMTIPAVYARLLLARAEVQQHMGDYEDAEADYRAAGRMIPDDPMIPFNRALVALQHGDERQAQQLCEQAIQLATPTLLRQMREAINAEAHYQVLRRLLE